MPSRKKAVATTRAGKVARQKVADPAGVTFQTQMGLARCTGFDLATVKKWLSDQSFPGGRKGPWNLADVLTWWREKKHRPAPAPEGDTQEHIRLEKLAMLRMERMKREGNLIERDKWQPFLGRVATVLRQAGDMLERQHGSEAHDVLDDAIVSFERECEHFFGAAAGAE